MVKTSGVYGSLCLWYNVNQQRYYVLTGLLTKGCTNNADPR